MPLRGTCSICANMDSESLNNKLEHNVTGYLFASSGLCLASFKFASAESLGRMRKVEPRLRTFAVRGGGT
jgi:hypothetical protein